MGIRKPQARLSVEAAAQPVSAKKKPPRERRPKSCWGFMNAGLVSPHCPDRRGFNAAAERRLPHLMTDYAEDDADEGSMTAPAELPIETLILDRS
jgi:hypothetical protein